MPTLVNLAFDIADLIGADFDVRRTKVWIETNIASGSVIDTTGKVVRLGDVKATVGTDGKGSFTGLFATNSADLNPTGFLYQVYVDYATRADGRRLWSSGWFSLTVSSDLATVTPVVSGPANSTDDAVIASRIDDPASLTRAAANKLYVPAVVVTGLDTTGGTDSAAAIQAKLDAAPSGATIVLPAGTLKLLTGLSITKSVRLVGAGVGKSSNDNTDPATCGTVLTYVATSGDAILTQPPNAVNSRIYVHLENLLVIGNRDVTGATGGGGIKLNGRALAGTAINSFSLVNAHVTMAKGDGLTILGDVYEGRIVGTYSTDNGGHGIVAGGGTGTTGEIAWFDVHAHDNGGDGIRLRAGSTHDMLRVSASRNTGAGLDAQSVVIDGRGIQLESNLGAAAARLDNISRGSLGVYLAYLTPTYNGHGIHLTNCRAINLDVFASGTLGAGKYDVLAEASCAKVRVLSYTPSTGGTVSLAPSNEVAGNYHGASAYMTVNRTATTGAALLLPLDAESFDRDGFHDTATNNTRFVVPNAMGGFYAVRGVVEFDTNATGVRQARIFKNGVLLSRGIVSVTPGGGGGTAVPFSFTLSLSAGDYIEVAALQTSGADLLVTAANTHVVFELMGY